MSPRIERLLFYAFAAVCLLVAMVVVWTLVAIDRLVLAARRWHRKRSLENER